MTTFKEVAKLQTVEKVYQVLETFYYSDDGSSVIISSHKTKEGADAILEILSKTVARHYATYEIKESDLKD